MAEFRKLFYAFGLAALLTGASSNANAQAAVCSDGGAVIPVIRSESYADLVGDVVLDCTGGTPTPSGSDVPRVNFTLTLSTHITSRLIVNGSSTYSEALLLIDEPNQAINTVANPLATSNRLLPCDQNQEDFGSNSNVCSIISNGVYNQTYDGTNNRVNAFQARPGINQGTGDFVSNILVFNGVPFDPPGTTDQGVARHRILRFTNIRANAPLVSSGFLLSEIVLNINVNNNNLVSIQNPQRTVARVARGLQTPTVVSVLNTYVQCDRTGIPSNSQSITFTEGFESSFKPKGLEQVLNNGSATVWGGGTTVAGLTGVVQNVPNANYNTESGFVADNGYSVPSPNPPAGISLGTAGTVGARNWPSPSRFNGAGVATQGTRLYVSFRDIPNGVTVSVPLSISLISTATSGATGSARLVSTASNGANTTVTTHATSGTIGTSLLAVYEIAYSDPAQIERLTIPVTIDYLTASLSSNLPEPFKTAQVSGGFAPYYNDSLAVHTAQSDTIAYPLPRFRNLPSPFADLFRINKCSCNLLFPFVTNAAAPGGNYDTGIAIANASLLPTGSGFKAGAGQEGAVQFWYYPSLSTAPPVLSQCTNTTTLGACPGTKTVKAGETLTYVISQNNPTWGLDNRAAGFTGYVVAQTQFQYCHAFAYISPQGALPTTNGMSVGYLGLVLDKDQLPTRTTYAGEALNQ